MTGTNSTRKAIFWDNDGILVDSEELYFEATRDALAARGFSLTREFFVNVSLQEGASVTERAAGGHLSPPELEALRLERNQRYTRLISQGVSPRQGIVACLNAIHGKATMGVVTASLRDHFDLLHRSTDLLRFFDFVIAYEDVPRSKPHADPYLEAVRRVKLPKENCLVVEDSERGLQAAVAAGLRCFMLPSDLTRGRRFDRAAKILDSMDDLRTELLRWLNA